VGDKKITDKHEESKLLLNLARERRRFVLSFTHDVSNSKKCSSSNKRDRVLNIQAYMQVIELGIDKYKAEALFELSEYMETEPIVYSSIPNQKKAFEFLIRAAELGNADAQHRLSIAYATGIYGRMLVPMDPSRSLFLEYMAALGGHFEANMGMGYRYLHGLGVTSSCELSAKHYEYTANEAADIIDHRGYALYGEKSRLTDLEKVASRGRREFDPEVCAVISRLSEFAMTSDIHLFTLR
jgi:hypothetical protein